MSLTNDLKKWLEMNNLKSFSEMCNLATLTYNTVRKSWNNNPIPLSVANKYRLNLLTGLCPLTEAEQIAYDQECKQKPWLKLAEIHATELIQKWKIDGSLPLYGINNASDGKTRGVEEYIDTIYPNPIVLKSDDVTPLQKKTDSNDLLDSLHDQLGQKKVDGELLTLSLRLVNKLFAELLSSDEKHISLLVSNNSKSLDDLTTLINIVRDENPHNKFKNSLTIKKLFND